MAQRSLVVLVDDIDHNAADETVQFGLDRVNYEIDLSSEHAAELRAALQKYIDVARKVHVKRGQPSSSTRPDKAQVAAIRDWARRNGLPVSQRGRISAEIVAKWEAAHR